MATKTWNGSTGTWATAGSWSPTGIPLSTDDVVINAGSVTIAGQTCNNLTIGGTCTITGTGLTVNGTFSKITTGTATFTHTAAITFNGSISNTGGTINQTGTGNFTIAGTTSTTANFGTNSLRLLNVTKTGAGAITFNTSAVNVTNSGSATTSIFTFNSGTITQNIEINCCASVNNGSTARTWAMNANLNITAAGAAVNCSWGHSGTCTLSSRTGKIVITGLSNGASTVTFPADAVTAAGSARAPNVRLEGTNVTWTMSGFVNNFEISGTCTAASAITVWGTVSGITATYYTFTGCSPTFYNTTNGQTITQNMGTVGTFGTVTFNCLASTTCTYVINSLAATNITCSGPSCTYRFGVQNDDTQTVRIVGAGTITLSAATATFTLYNVRSYNMSLTSSGTYNCYTYTHNSFTNPATAGTVTHTTGTLTMKSGYTMTTWTFNSSSGSTRALTFEDNSFIKTIGSGAISTVTTGLTGSCAFDNAGFLHEGTGTPSFGGVPASQNAGFNLTLSKTSLPSGYVRNLTILDGTIITTSTTINVLKNFTGYTSGAMTGLTVAQAVAGGTVNYTGNPIVAYTNSVGSITQNITQCSAVGYTLSGTSSTYNMGVTGSTSMSLSTNGTITLGGVAATYNLNNVRGYNLALNGNGTYNCYYYEHNYYNANPPTAGTITHNTGTLVIKTGTTLITWAFRSDSGSTRGITFEDNSFITTLNNGTINVTYPALTGSCAFDNAGFLHPSTGTFAFAGTPSGNADTAFNFWFSTVNNNNGTPTVRNLTIVDGASVTSAATLIFCKRFTGYTSSSMSGLTVQQSASVSGSAYVDYSGSLISAFTSSNTSGVNQYIYNLNAPTITLGYTNNASVYIGSDGTNHNGIVSINTTGTVTLGGTCTYNIYHLRGYNATLSNTGTYNCYYYEHNYFNQTGGTVTHTAGTLVLKTNLNIASMTTWTFTSTGGTRGITFETDSYITNFNTGAINYQYSSALTAVSAQTMWCGFVHNGTGQWQADFSATPPAPNACFNFYWSNIIALAGSGVFYARNLGNQGWQLIANNNYTFNPGWGTGSGCFTNTSARTIYIAGDVLVTGESGISPVISDRTQWQQLNLTFFANDNRIQKFSTLGSWYNGSASLRIGTVTLDTAFNGTLQLGYDAYSATRVFSESYDGNAQVTNFVHNGGTLDIRSRYLYVESQYSSTSTNATNKYINSSYASFNDPAIYINGTTGMTWSFSATDSLISNYKIWIYIRGGTVSHGSSTRSTANQPSFNLIENAGTYTLAPTTNFQVSSLIINNYSVANNSVWTINGPKFEFYGTTSAPAAFTVNILGAGTGNSANSCQMYVDNNSFAWPQVNISGNTQIICSNFKFKNININGGTTTSSGQFVEVTGTLGSAYWGSSGTLNISNSNWVFRGANAIDYGYLGVGFPMISDSTGTATFDGINGTQQGDQSAGFYTNFGGKIVNNISYDPNTGVGTLYLTAGFATDFTIPTASQIDFNYTTSSVNFLADKNSLSAYGFPIKGSTFNIGTSSSGYRYIRSRSGNWSNWGIYNTEGNSVVSGDYLNIANCTAKGGGGWYAGTHSINGGGTTGWNFYSPPTFSLSRSAASVNEGTVLTITLATNLPNSSTVAYTITGITSADINGASLTGNFTINDGTANVVLNVTNDFATEGNETLTLSLDNGAGSISVTIVDTSLLPTYSLARSAASVTEGDSFTITLTTTNLPNGTTVPYTITGVSSSDINDASLTGNFTISSNSASLVVNTTWDYVTEGTETFTLTINPTYGTGSSISVAINNLLHPTYALSATPTSLNEGGNFTINLTTTDVANNTTLPYTITGVSSADINGASLTGNFTVVSNTASATFTTTQDYVTEGDETFVLTLNTIGANVSVLLIDYTKTRTYSLSTDVTTTVTEGGSFNITLTTTNVFNGTLVPYTITGVSSADINNASLTGNFTINTNSGSQSFTTTIDGIAEGTETFTLTLGSPASGSINVSIVDPSAVGTNFSSAFLLFE
jgi:hypothetical protein